MHYNQVNKTQTVVCTRICDFFIKHLLPSVYEQRTKGGGKTPSGGAGDGHCGGQGRGVRCGAAGVAAGGGGGADDCVLCVPDAVWGVG